MAVDEAHATGIMGEQGAGCWSYCRLKWEKHVLLMGTLSKAVGTQGGYICASEELIHFLINHCRPFIYSTGISPLLAGMAHFNITRIRDDASLRNRLKANMDAMREALQASGFALPDEPSPIFPVKVGESQRALACARELKRKGFITAAIRPPTVREGTARLRLSVSAAHQPNELVSAVQHISEFIHNDGESKKP